MRQGKVLDTMHAPYAGTGMQRGASLGCCRRPSL